MIDGVFTGDGERVDFQPARRPTRDDVAEVVAVAARRVERLLERRCVAAASEERDVPDAWSEETPILACIAAAAVQGRVALGMGAGAQLQRYVAPCDDLRPAALVPATPMRAASTFTRAS